MIGALNERGRSWPDLDMLPLGWLTDPGKTLHFSRGFDEFVIIT